METNTGHNDENADPIAIKNKEIVQVEECVDKTPKVGAKDKLERMKQNYYATRVQACTRGMLVRKLLNSQDGVDSCEKDTEIEFKEAVKEMQEQDELAAADENPDYGYGTGNREEDEEARHMTDDERRLKLRNISSLSDAENSKVDDEPNKGDKSPKSPFNSRLSIRTKQEVALEETAEMEELQKIEKEESIEHSWPIPLREDFTDQTALTRPPLEPIGKCLKWIERNKKILIRAITWNLQANTPPSIEDIRKELLRENTYHLYIIGSEECENSIAYSAVNTKKDKWMGYLQEALGKSYVKIRSQTLQAINLILFAHESVATLISDVHSAAVPCGLGNTLGNKGGVSISFMFCDTTFLFTNAHLTAHQDRAIERNDDYARIDNQMPTLLRAKGERGGIEKRRPSTMIANYWENQDTESVEEKEDQDKVESVQNSEDVSRQRRSIHEVHSKQLLDCADRVIFMGDLNYRIRGSRAAVDKLLEKNMHAVLLENDQLKWYMEKGNVLSGFKEASLHFRPTFKFDKMSDVYDTSKKKRIPAWTDRILYVNRGLKCIGYDAVMDLRTSDHRPVYASFYADIESDGSHMKILDQPEYEEESQVCTLM